MVDVVIPIESDGLIILKTTSGKRIVLSSIYTGDELVINRKKKIPQPTKTG
ncbi:MAG: hypothetical protein MUO73_03220 [Thermoplasmata archaeon]|nr:hypothetical protein [Thermoplasmata archaeon]